MDRIRIAGELARLARALLTASIADSFEKTVRRKGIGGRIPDDDEIRAMREFIDKSGTDRDRKIAAHALALGCMTPADGRDMFVRVAEAFGRFKELNYQRDLRTRGDFLKYADIPGYADAHPGDAEMASLAARMREDGRRDRIRSFSPAAEFGRGFDAGNGVVFYDVEDSERGMSKVRRALDAAYGRKRNPWCLSSRNDSVISDFDDDYEEYGTRHGDEETDIEKNGLLNAWFSWVRYDGTPKRIAYRGGVPVAFYANWQWYDISNVAHDEFPLPGVSEDPSFERRLHDDDRAVEELAIGECDENRLRELAGNPSSMVRAELAKMRGLPEELMLILANDPRKSVRLELVQNPDATMKVLELMENDHSPWISELAEKRIDELDAAN